MEREVHREPAPGYRQQDQFTCTRGFRDYPTMELAHSALVPPVPSGASSSQANCSFEPYSSAGTTLGTRSSSAVPQTRGSVQSKAEGGQSQTASHAPVTPCGDSFEGKLAKLAMLRSPASPRQWAVTPKYSITAMTEQAHPFQHHATHDWRTLRMTCAEASSCAGSSSGSAACTDSSIGATVPMVPAAPEIWTSDSSSAGEQTYEAQSVQNLRGEEGDEGSTDDGTEASPGERSPRTDDFDSRASSGYLPPCNLEVLVGPTRHAFQPISHDRICIPDVRTGEEHSLRSCSNSIFLSDVMRLKEHTHGRKQVASFGSLNHLCRRYDLCRPCVYNLQRSSGCSRRLSCEFCHLHDRVRHNGKASRVDASPRMQYQ